MPNDASTGSATPPHGAREGLVSRAFVTLADTLVDGYDVIALLDRLVTFSVELLPVEAAGIVLGDSRRELRAVAASDEAAHAIEVLQLRSDEGPCLDCFRTAAPVSVADLSEAADRWPTFVAAVARSSTVRSVHALPLRLRGRAIGALNLFHAVPGPLPEPDLALGQALADVATVGILQERAARHSEVLSEQLRGALTSRVVIEQAKGVLAQHSGLDPAAALGPLRRHARSHNLKLAELARRIVDRDVDPAEILDADGGPGRSGRPRPG